jgi:hypothetical protein
MLPQKSKSRTEDVTKTEETSSKDVIETNANHACFINTTEVKSCDVIDRFSDAVRRVSNAWWTPGSQSHNLKLSLF